MTSHTNDTHTTNLIARTDAALNDFIHTSVIGYESTTAALAELLHGMQLLAGQISIDWSSVRAEAAAIRAAAAKSAKPAKAPKVQPERQAEPAACTVTVTDPTGRKIVEQRPEAYAFAILQFVAGEWTVRSRVNTKVVASSRIHTFRTKGGIAREHLVIAPASWAPLASQPLAEVVELVCMVEAPTLPQLAEVVEVERELVTEEPFHVKVNKGAAVHLSDDGESTYCGKGSDNDYRQVEDAISCASCQRAADRRASGRRAR